MSALLSFGKKELTEYNRGGKTILLLILFLLFGVMNPAIAKLTPWMMEMVADSMEETGLTITAVKVDAMSSWTQFYKNAPIIIIAFLIIFAGVLTKEYQSGTLINMVTKGLSRWKVLAAKGLVMSLVWTAGYWLMFAVTYAYNQFFWPETEVLSPFFAALCLYIAGLWLISLLLLGSVITSTGNAAIGFAGLGFVLSYLLGLIPKLFDYTPAKLTASSVLLTGAAEKGDFIPAIIITAALIILQTAVSVALFNQRTL